MRSPPTARPHRRGMRLTRRLTGAGTRAVHLAAAAAMPDSAAARRVASANSVASDLFVDCEWRAAGD